MNSRYIAYAAAHGNSAQEQLAADDLEHPGGQMAGFILWISDAWRRWAAETGERRECGDSWSERQHCQFDGWLAVTYVCNCWHERDAWGLHKHDLDCAVMAPS